MAETFEKSVFYRTCAINDTGELDETAPHGKRRYRVWAGPRPLIEKRIFLAYFGGGFSDLASALAAIDRCWRDQDNEEEVEFVAPDSPDHSYDIGVDWGKGYDYSVGDFPGRGTTVHQIDALIDEIGAKLLSDPEIDRERLAEATPALLKLALLQDELIGQQRADLDNLRATLSEIGLVVERLDLSGEDLRVALRKTLLEGGRLWFAGAAPTSIDERLAKAQERFSVSVRDVQARMKKILRDEDDD